MMYCVYERPSDYPKSFVVRRWLVGGLTAVPDREAHAVTKTLDEARAAIPVGLVRLDRAPNDDAVVSEVWL